MTHNNNRAITTISLIIAGFALLGAIGNLWPEEQSSSFTHYSDSTWQVNDTLYWRHGTDTIKLDASKIK